MNVMVEAEPHGGASLVGRSLGAYHILEALGSGGMGEVYLAQDTRLERRVALKVLPPEMASHPDKIERFEREARAVASLSHPGIVVLHSIEEADGIRFLTMEHVEGETLGKAIPAGGFSVDRFLPLAITLTDAVSAAHQQGILHRDLKPDNVMLTAGDRLKVLDFGLAKLLADTPPEADRSSRETKSVTQDGRIVGTVAYMSPEQAQGLPVDHRSDVFSLGILLYEMASGERPFKGHTNLSVLSSILKDTPRPVSQIREDVPKPLARMIQRALEKRPEDRYQSAADLRRDLEDLKRDVDSGELRLATTAGQARLMAGPSGRRRWLVPAVVAAGVVALGLVSFFLRRDRHPAPMGSDGRRSLAVFYFDNLSGDPKLDWLRTGLTDMMVTGLSQSSTLRVLSTARLYQILDELGHRDDAATSAQVVASVARRAEAATALVGSFVRAGSQLRIQAQLQDPRSGEVLASERVEGNADDGLFALVDELTSRIRGRLETASMVKGGDKKLEEVTTSSLEAYKLYAEGLRLHDRLQEHEAQALFEKAVAADPGFASALAKLSVVHANLGDKQKAREYAGRALERSEKLPAGERHYIEGRYYSLDPATLEKAIGAYQAAVDATPDHTAARNNLAQLLLGARRYSEALVHLEELRRRGMSFPGTYMSLAEAYAATGQDKKAEEVLRGYVAEHSDRGAGYENLAFLLVSRGRFEEALQACARAEQLNPRSDVAQQGRLAVHMLRGEWDQAEATAKKIMASSDPLLHFKGGAALVRVKLYRGDVATARQLTDEGLALAGGRPDDRAGLRLFRSDLEAELGRTEAALAEALRALDEGPVDTGLQALAHTRGAVHLTHLGRAAEARGHLEAVEAWLKLMPRALADPERLHFQGDLAAARGDTASARVLYEKAIAAQPPKGIMADTRVAEINYDLARAALAGGRREQATRALRDVIDAGLGRLDLPLPYVRSLALLARLEDEAGRPQEARRLYERYLACWKGGQIDRDQVTGATRRLAALPAPAA